MGDTAALNSLLGAARHMPGDVAGVPAGLWWPAFVLVVIDTGCKADDALAALRSAFDPAEETLALGSFVFALHPHSAEALGALLREHRSPKLFPWPAGAKLEDGLRSLVWNAPLWNTHRTNGRRAPFSASAALAQLAALPRDALDHVDPSAPFVPRGAPPQADYCVDCGEYVEDDTLPHACRPRTLRWWASPGRRPPLASRDPRAKGRQAADDGAPNEMPKRRAYQPRVRRLAIHGG